MIYWKVDEESSSDFTIIAFKVILDDSSNLQVDFVSSNELTEDKFLDS